jgi:hypothetical protein
MDGKEMTDESIKAALDEARVPASIAKATKAMVNGVMEFLDAEEPQVYWSESTVYSRTHLLRGHGRPHRPHAYRREPPAGGHRRQDVQVHL